MALVVCVVSGTAFKRPPEYHRIAFKRREAFLLRGSRDSRMPTPPLGQIAHRGESPLFWPHLHLHPNKDFTYQCPPTTGAQQPKNLQSYGLLLWGHAYYNCYVPAK